MGHPEVGLCQPELLNPEHGFSEFDSGEEELDKWLRKRALQNQLTGATRTYAMCDGQTVAGYYALAAGAVTITSAPGRFRRNMPDPIPVAILARLAVDRRYQGKGLGRNLVKDAAFRVLVAADVIGIRGLLVHAISEDIKRFYRRLGFEDSPEHTRMMMITLADLRKT